MTKKVKVTKMTREEEYQAFLERVRSIKQSFPGNFLEGQLAKFVPYSLDSANQQEIPSDLEREKKIFIKNCKQLALLNLREVEC